LPALLNHEPQYVLNPLLPFAAAQLTDTPEKHTPGLTCSAIDANAIDYLKIHYILEEK